jgi:hypothetical protein
MDEFDMIYDPLRSDLNYPIDKPEKLDNSETRASDESMKLILKNLIFTV